ncbi:MAG TPA: hypothetical protein VIN08_20810 [Ohtaekwangia sp.]|uniref:hypothetical protein n=1 Tax=Ohtaekwangia sp. TaxID=2066019 RepID=UPI002F942FE1
MNRRSILFLFLIATGILAACSGKKEATAEEHAHEHEAAAAADVANEEWKEMDEFHMLMAEAFHPYKDSSNLETAKAKASDLATSAEKWANAPLPRKVDTEDTKKKLEELKTGTAAFVETVKAGNDKAIGEELTKLHDLFHSIQELWYEGGEHKH